MARATLESVARRAEVSRQTVSNVLNAPHLVRPETLARVHAAIEELHYRPNWAARTLRTQRSRLVGARLEPPRDGVNAVVLERFLHALTVRSQEAGYRVLVFAADGDDDEVVAYQQLLDDHDLDAFVLTGTHAGDARTSWLARRHIPFLTFGRPWGVEHPGHSWVDVDNAAGTRAATEHLVARGHRRIAFLGWPAGSGVGDDRRAGWAAACEAAGLDVTLDVQAPDGVGVGRSASEELLDHDDPPTAFVCASDSFALGLWSAVTARGGRVGGTSPGDAAVVGFDDSPTAAVVGLTSVAQPHEGVAAWCLRLLHDLLDTDAERLPAAYVSAPPPAPAGTVDPGPPPSVLLPPRLVVRAST